MNKSEPLSPDMLKGIIGGTRTRHYALASDVAFIEPEPVEGVASSSKADAASPEPSKSEMSSSPPDTALHTGAPVIHYGEGEDVWSTIKKQLYID